MLQVASENRLWLLFRIHSALRLANSISWYYIISNLWSHCVELHLKLLSKLTWKVIPHMRRELQSKGPSCDYDLPTCFPKPVFLTSLVTLFLNVPQSPFQYQVSFLSQLSIACLCLDWYNLESVVFISCWRHFRSVRLHFLAETLETRTRFFPSWCIYSAEVCLVLHILNQLLVSH